MMAIGKPFLFGRTDSGKSTCSAEASPSPSNAIYVSNSLARANTLSNMGSVKRPVKVFC